MCVCVCVSLNKLFSIFSTIAYFFLGAVTYFVNLFVLVGYSNGIIKWYIVFFLTKNAKQKMVDHH